MIDLHKEDEKLFALVGACSVMSFFVPPHSRNSSNFFTLFPPCIPIGVLVVKRSFSKSEKQKELPTKHLFSAPAGSSLFILSSYFYFIFANRSTAFVNCAIV